MVSSAPRVQPGSAQEVGLGAVRSWLASPHSVTPIPCPPNSRRTLHGSSFFSAQHGSPQEQAQALPGTSGLFPIPRLRAVVLAGGWKSSDLKRGSGLVADGSLLGCLFVAVQRLAAVTPRTLRSPSYGPEEESGAHLCRCSGSSLDGYTQFAYIGKAV